MIKALILLLLTITILKQYLCHKLINNKGDSMSDNKKVIIRKLKSNFSEIQKDLINREPVLGASRWFLTDFKFLDNNKIKIIMEDGHVCHSAVLVYDLEKEVFSLEVEKDEF